MAIASVDSRAVDGSPVSDERRDDAPVSAESTVLGEIPAVLRDKLAEDEPKVRAAICRQHFFSILVGGIFYSLRQMNDSHAKTSPDKATVPSFTLITFP